MSVELEHAEQVMLEHEKENFAVHDDKPDKHKQHKDKNTDDEGGPAKYKSLYLSFDVLKPLEDMPPSLHKVLHVTRRC